MDANGIHPDPARRHAREDCALSLREHDRGECTGRVDYATGEPLEHPDQDRVNAARRQMERLVRTGTIGQCLIAAAREEDDFAAYLAEILAAVARECGGPAALIKRPGSWESAALAQLIGDPYAGPHLPGDREAEYLDPEHTCHAGPLCAYWYAEHYHADDPGGCAHDSCMEITHENCPGCQAEGDDTTDVMCPNHGPAEMVGARSYTGHAGGRCVAVELACGCTLVDESADVRAAR